jgi:SAM-dependent methyltransferase
MSRSAVNTGGPAETSLGNEPAFDAVSQAYDSQINPLLLLEQRFMERMLPEISGRDVLDAGCGSGRWLAYLAEKRPHSVCGIDASDAMLQVARGKRIPGVELVQCPCQQTALPDHSIDLIVSSFVLGHIQEIGRLALEFTRIARSGCDLFLSDMHPKTQLLLGWKRAFRVGESEIEFDTVRHGLDRIISLFGELGWEATAGIEPEFGAAERDIFDASRRLHRYVEAEGHPAIYILHLRKRAPGHARGHQDCQAVIRRARCAIGPRESTHGSLGISGGRVANMLSDELTSFSPDVHGPEIDLTGYLLMPGLVNAHDHLEFALFPRLANSHYPNATVWAHDVQHTFKEVIAKHRSIPRPARLWWGGIRNLLCGATTVCHHNAPEPVIFSDDFPIRVVRDYAWEHSLEFGGDLRAARSRTPAGLPFILHACEGIDQEAREELWQLDRLRILDEDTVIVHGLAIDDEGAALIERRGVSLVLCPSSNNFLFATVQDIQRFAGIPRLALGSDSPLTAEGDLLDEVRFAIGSCGVTPRLAYRLVTEGPAAILRLRNGEGSIKIGGNGDLVAIRDPGCDAVEALRTLSAADVELVMVDGCVKLASRSIWERLPTAMREGMEALCVDGEVRWLRAPVSQLLAAAEEVLGKGRVRLGGKPVRMPATAEMDHA